MPGLLYVCLDGLGDDPIPAFDGRTPLEAAATPALDHLAQRGRTGLVTTVGEGLAPESDIGVFGILGYDPGQEHPGRGVIEAIGSDVPFEDGDLALRINFATADWPEILDRRVGRDLSSDDARALAAEVTDALHLADATFELKATVEHRGALVIRSSDALSADVSNTDPAYRKEGSLGIALETFDPFVQHAGPLAQTDAARRSADLVNAFVEGSASILDASDVNRSRRAQGRLPANLILTRDAGDHRPQLEPIRERFGRTWGCFVEMPVERGIAIALGMEEIPAPRLLTDPTDPSAGESYAVWAELAAAALNDHEAVYVHIKGPDLPAHDGNAEGKRDIIALIDAAFFDQVLGIVDLRSTTVAVTADHSTSCLRAAHTADPVPLVAAGEGIQSDGTTEFGETACAAGALGSMMGVEVLPRLLASR